MNEKLNMYWFEEKQKMEEEEKQLRDTSTHARQRTKRISEDLRSKLEDLLSTISHTLDQNGRQLADTFDQLPLREDFPDYYALIKKPIALANMRAKIAASQYRSLRELEQDLRLMCSNARQYDENNLDIVMASEKVKHIMVRILLKLLTLKSLTTTSNSTGKICKQPWRNGYIISYCNLRRRQRYTRNIGCEPCFGSRRNRKRNVGTV